MALMRWAGVSQRRVAPAILSSLTSRRASSPRSASSCPRSSRHEPVHPARDAARLGRAARPGGRGHLGCRRRDTGASRRRRCSTSRPTPAWASERRAKLERLADGVQPYWLSLEAQAYGSTGGTQLHFLSIDLPSSPARAGGWTRSAASGATSPRATTAWEITAPSSTATRSPRPPRWRGSARGASSPVRSRCCSATASCGSSSTRRPAHSSRARRRSGCRAAAYSEVAAGLAWDTRDDELAPTRGLLLETSVRSTLQALGSTGNAVGVFSSASLYQPIAERLVAGRPHGDRRGVGRHPLQPRG